MHIQPEAIPGLLLIRTELFTDARGSFQESFNARRFAQATGLDMAFVQDNHSRSARNVLRGLHYQIRQAQGKLVRVTKGEVFDVAVDLRRSAPTFGQWAGVRLSAESRLQRWIPPGFAHGFLVTGDDAEVLYKTTDYWAPEWERTLLWSDTALGIEWPLPSAGGALVLPLLSDKDRAGVPLQQAEIFS